MNELVSNSKTFDEAAIYNKKNHDCIPIGYSILSIPCNQLRKKGVA
jgi:hypothetical protein